MGDQAQYYAVSLQPFLILVIILLQTLICFNFIQSELLKQNVVPSRDGYLWVNADYKPSDVDQGQSSWGNLGAESSHSSAYKILDPKIFDPVWRGRA